MVQANNELINLSAHYKILRVMYDLGHGDSVPLSLENITVNVFKKYPSEFSMFGYPNFPDTLKVSRRLYLSLKPGGLVRTADNKFQLTDMGLDTANKLTSSASHKPRSLPRALIKERNRIMLSQAYALYVNGEQDRILDTDFYEYLGVSVRTPYNELLGRKATIEMTIRLCKAAKSTREKEANILSGLHSFLMNKYATAMEVRKRK